MRTEIVRQMTEHHRPLFAPYEIPGPTDVAIIDGAEVLTYQEAVALVRNTLSIHLWDFGIRKGDDLRIFPANGVDLIVLYHSHSGHGRRCGARQLSFYIRRGRLFGQRFPDAELLIYAPEHQSVAIDAAGTSITVNCRYSAASLFAMRYLTCAREVSRIPPRISRCSKRAAHPGFNLQGGTGRPRAPLVPCSGSREIRDIWEP